MYDIVKPIKLSIYVNSGNKTMGQIKSELGCSHLINGGTFDGYFRPCCWLKADGKLLHSESWSDWGYGWNDTDIVMDSSAHISKYRNFISCVSMISPGPFIVPSEMGGCRGRTAIGLTADNRVIPFVTKDGTKDALYPSELKEKMEGLGAVSALMLDGGISSRGIFPSGTVTENKKRLYLQNYIAIWTEPVEDKPQNPQVANPQCPYDEPRFNVRWGSLGNPAKWVQWMLNQHGASLDVDGLFFGKSVEALQKFQHDHGLAWDGVCGEKTREALRK